MAPGVEDVCDQHFPQRLFKKFNDATKGRMYWEEAKETGVVDLLRYEPVRNEVFIVLAGIKPGVYASR